MVRRTTRIKVFRVVIFIRVLRVRRLCSESNMSGYYARALIKTYHFDADVYIVRSQLPVARGRVPRKTVKCFEGRRKRA